MAFSTSASSSSSHILSSPISETLSSISSLTPFNILSPNSSPISDSSSIQHHNKSSMPWHRSEYYDDALKLVELSDQRSQTKSEENLNKAQKIKKYMNQADVVLNLAGRYFKDKAMTVRFARTAPRHIGSQPPSLCLFHGVHSLLLPHERIRILESWYCLKFLSILYELHDDEHKRLLEDLKTKIRALPIIDLYILWALDSFVCERIETIAIREYLEVEDINSYGREEEVEANPKTEAWEWVDSFVSATYEEKRNYGFDDYETILRGLVDVCPEESGVGHCPGQPK